MIIYPAIDLRQGNCVRLVQGDFGKETIYSRNALETAMIWQTQSAQYLHLVDLDGAKNEEWNNTAIAIEIASQMKIPVQFGGGLRSAEKIAFILGAGISRVILGTAAVRDKKLLKQSLKKFGERIVVSIDAANGYVATDGWLNKSTWKATEFAKSMQASGVKTIIYTDIAKDGMMQGPNMEAMEEMVKNVSMEVIASGGIRSLEDIRNLKNTGVKGAVIGKALYTGAIKLEEAVKC